MIDPRGYFLNYLEWMVTTSCDLACPGCDRFIDYDHPWHEDFDQMKINMTKWSKRLDPNNFTIIGGEPLIHPKIYEIIEHSRRTFNHAKIEVFSNGFLLPKRNELFDALVAAQPSKLSITLHHKDEKLRQTVLDNIQTHIIRSARKWIDEGNGLWRHKEHNVELQITDPTAGGWYDYRQNINGVLKPWQDNDPVSSYNFCNADVYPIIYKNKLYKCPPISMLKTHAKKYNMLEDKDWAPYLKYEGLSLDCSEYELQGFIHNIEEPHPICAMCPAKPVLKDQPEAVVKGTFHEKPL